MSTQGRVRHTVFLLSSGFPSLSPFVPFSLSSSHSSLSSESWPRPRVMFRLDRIRERIRLNWEPKAIDRVVDNLDDLAFRDLAHMNDTPALVVLGNHKLVHKLAHIVEIDAHKLVHTPVHKLLHIVEIGNH